MNTWTTEQWAAHAGCSVGTRFKTPDGSVMEIFWLSGAIGEPPTTYFVAVRCVESPREEMVGAQSTAMSPSELNAFKYRVPQRARWLEKMVSGGIERLVRYGNQ